MAMIGNNTQAFIEKEVERLYTEEYKGIAKEAIRQHSHYNTYRKFCRTKAEDLYGEAITLLEKIKNNRLKYEELRKAKIRVALLLAAIHTVERVKDVKVLGE